MRHFNQSTNEFLFKDKKIDDFNLEQLIEIYNDLLFTVISLRMAISKMEKVINETMKYSKELKGTLAKTIM
jgi:hypothetical protein